MSVRLRGLLVVLGSVLGGVVLYWLQYHAGVLPKSYPLALIAIVGVIWGLMELITGVPLQIWKRGGARSRGESPWGGSSSLPALEWSSASSTSRAERHRPSSSRTCLWTESGPRNGGQEPFAEQRRYPADAAATPRADERDPAVPR